MRKSEERQIISSSHHMNLIENMPLIGIYTYLHYLTAMKN